MIISLRGTNGSGKSTVIRALFKKCKEVRPLYGVLGSINAEAHRLVIPKCKTPTFALGPYMRDRHFMPTGGCDLIIPYDLILRLIEKYAAKGHVIFEGVIVTSVYGRVGTLMEGWGKDSVFMFLDTPLEECLRRIEARRGGRLRDTRLAKHVEAKYKTALRVKHKVEEEGIMRCIEVSSETAAGKIIKLLQEA